MTSNFSVWRDLDDDSPGLPYELGHCWAWGDPLASPVEPVTDGFLLGDYLAVKDVVEFLASWAAA